ASVGLSAGVRSVVLGGDTTSDTTVLLGRGTRNGTRGTVVADGAPRSYRPHVAGAASAGATAARAAVGCSAVFVAALPAAVLARLLGGAALGLAAFLLLVAAPVLGAVTELVDGAVGLVGRNALEPVGGRVDPLVRELLARLLDVVLVRHELLGLVEKPHGPTPLVRHTTVRPLRRRRGPAVGSNLRAPTVVRTAARPAPRRET